MHCMYMQISSNKVLFLYNKSGEMLDYRLDLQAFLRYNPHPPLQNQCYVVKVKDNRGGVTTVYMFQQPAVRFIA